MKTAPAASNVNIEMQRYYAGQNYREAAGAAPAPSPGWPGAAPYEAAHPGNRVPPFPHIVAFCITHHLRISSCLIKHSPHYVHVITFKYAHFG